MSSSLRLSDLLTRGLAIEWYEAVALVRAVTERVLEASGGQDVPELHQAELTPDGRITLTGSSRTDEPVRRLGQLLHAALTQSEPPVQLRLTVAQATAPAPGFGSVREFCDALGYFERPHRSFVLASLYARAAAAPAPASGGPATLDTLAPLEPDEEPTLIVSRPRPGRRAFSVAIAVLLVVALSGAGAYAYWRYTGPQVGSKDLSTMALKASDAVGTALVSGLSSVTERVGLGRLASKDPAGSVPPAAPTTHRPAPTSGVKKGSRAPANPVPFRAFDLEPVPPLDRSRPPTGSAALVSPTAQPSLPANENGTATDPTIYSAVDDVVPPVGVRPQLPRVLPSDLNKDHLATIELVVLPDGRVGSVKLLGHRNVHDAMFLSAVKAWEFRPALRNGRPVAYRKTIWLVLE